MPIFVVARAIPIVRTNNPIRDFCAAKTCSMRERTLDFSALARRVLSGMGLPRWLLAVNAADEAISGQEVLVGGRAVGAVRPHDGGSVGLVQQALTQTRAFIGGGVRDHPRPDQPEAPIDADVFLVAERRNGDVDRWPGAVGALLGLGELDRPAGVPVLLPELTGTRLQLLGNAPFLDLPLLVIRVTLLGRRHEARIDDLASHGDEAGRPKRRVKALEKAFDRPGPGELLAEQPDRARVRHPVGQSQAQEAHEREPVVDQELGALVGEGVGSLDDQDLEHHNWIEGRPAALRARPLAKGSIEIGPEDLEVHGSPERLELVAQVAQPTKAIINIKEARFAAHRSTSASCEVNHETDQQARFLEPSSF